MVLFVVLFYLVVPAGILYLCKRFSFFGKFGAVGIAYILGMLLGNLHFFGKSLSYFFGKFQFNLFIADINGFITVVQGIYEKIKPIQDNLAVITIALALPLILFTINLRQWSKLAGRTILSMILGIVAILTSIFIGFYFFGHRIDESWKVAGLLTGVYLGATFNMAAIQISIGASEEMFGIVNAIDIVVSILYFFFLTTIAQRLFNRFLPAFKKVTDNNVLQHQLEEKYEGWEAYKGIFSKQYIIPLIFALLLAIVIAGLAFGISKLLVFAFPAAQWLFTGFVILSITTLSIICSAIHRINTIKKTFQSGMYLIIIFCLVIGSLADFTMFATTSVYLLWYVFLVIFGSLFLHFLLAWIFRIDTDTVLISSSAMILSPPFVPSVANALHNKDIILSGITVGIIGYSIGNYIGVAIAYLLR